MTLTAILERLTKPQQRALDVIGSSRYGEVQQTYLRDVYGITKHTLNSLWRHDLLDTGANASGPYWSITDAGRSALARKEQQ